MKGIYFLQHTIPRFITQSFLFYRDRRKTMKHQWGKRLYNQLNHFPSGTTVINIKIYENIETYI